MGPRPAQTASAAVPLLHQFGVAIGFWLLARQAARAGAIARREVARTPTFLRGKIALARHFAGHVLPHAEGYFLAATQGRGQRRGVRRRGDLRPPNGDPRYDQ